MPSDQTLNTKHQILSHSWFLTEQRHTLDELSTPAYNIALFHYIYIRSIAGDTFAGLLIFRCPLSILIESLRKKTEPR